MSDVQYTRWLKERLKAMHVHTAWRGRWKGQSNSDYGMDFECAESIYDKMK